jgi:hypothetical protein
LFFGSNQKKPSSFASGLFRVRNFKEQQEVVTTSRRGFYWKIRKTPL